MSRASTGRRLLDVREGEWGLYVVLLAVMAATAMTLEISYVLSVSGFLAQVGVRQVPLLWLADMALILGLTGLYSLVVDRVSRLKLVRGLLIALLAVHLLLKLLLSYGVSEQIIYSLLYLLAEQQYMIFPLAFWALGASIFTPADSKRLFPLIGGGAVIGRIAGSGLAALSAQSFAARGIHPSELLLVNAGLFLLGFVLVNLPWVERAVPARREGARESRESVRDYVAGTFAPALRFVREVPMFAFLTLAMLGAGFALTVIEYHFFLVSGEAFPTAEQYQLFYGGYRLALTLAILFVQATIAGPLLRRVGQKNLFLALPATLAAALGGMLAVPGILGGAVGRFGGWLVLTALDDPARQSFQGLIPDESRGRITAFLNGYLYPLGTLLGALVVGAILLTESVGGMAAQWVAPLYLGLALLASLGALGAAWRLRASYESSLLNPRLTQRRRRGGNARTRRSLDALIDQLDELPDPMLKRPKPQAFQRPSDPAVAADAPPTPQPSSEAGLPRAGRRRAGLSVELLGKLDDESPATPYRPSDLDTAPLDLLIDKLDGLQDQPITLPSPVDFQRPGRAEAVPDSDALPPKPTPRSRRGSRAAELLAGLDDESEDAPTPPRPRPVSSDLLNDLD